MPREMRMMSGARVLAHRTAKRVFPRRWCRNRGDVSTAPRRLGGFALLAQQRSSPGNSAGADPSTRRSVASEDGDRAGARWRRPARLGARFGTCHRFARRTLPHQHGRASTDGHHASSMAASCVSPSKLASAQQPRLRPYRAEPGQFSWPSQQRPSGKLAEDEPLRWDLLAQLACRSAPTFW